MIWYDMDMIWYYMEWCSCVSRHIHTCDDTNTILPRPFRFMPSTTTRVGYTDPRTFTRSICSKSPAARSLKAPATEVPVGGGGGGELGEVCVCMGGGAGGIIDTDRNS